MARIPAIRPYIVKVLSNYSLLYPQPLHRLRVVYGLCSLTRIEPKGASSKKSLDTTAFWKIIEIHVVTKRFVYYLISVVRIVHATNIEISNRKLQKS